MRYGSIYVATNTVTGEQYVGQTRQRVERRWKCHVNTANSAVAAKHDLAKAILKYGKESIRFEEIYAAFDADELDAAEMNYIEWLKPAYNRTKGGAGHRAVQCSELLKKARSERMSRLWADPEWKANQVEKLKSAHSNEQAQIRCREINKLASEKNKQKIICPAIDKVFSGQKEVAQYFGSKASAVRYALERGVKGSLPYLIYRENVL